MRTTKDRIRHALGFEIIGLLIFAPLASLVFHYDLFELGLMALVGSVIATVWNYFYNILFDHGMLKLRGDVRKTTPVRVLHAILFEGGLLLLFLPMIAWHLNISLWDAFIMDIAMSCFYLTYTFFYNLAYDRIFPVPNPTAHNC
ncbi:MULTISPECIES: PACE efflux transporter [Oceanimonas]|uniref:PACE efflux transporter n=1 Tax=Oceanimonas TaxID=129577 RepID=UPI00036AD9ED|nr:PACE efflux transporter [Oceanimonas smirnovii]